VSNANITQSIVVGIATVCQVKPAFVTATLSVVRRRLEFAQQPRLLQITGSVQAAYTVTVSAGSPASGPGSAQYAMSQMKAAHVSIIQTTVNAALQKTSPGIQIGVISLSAPSSLIGTTPSNRSPTAKVACSSYGLPTDSEVNTNDCVGKSDLETCLVTCADGHTGTPVEYTCLLNLDIFNGSGPNCHNIMDPHLQLIGPVNQTELARTENTTAIPPAYGLANNPASVAASGGIAIFIAVTVIAGIILLLYLCWRARKAGLLGANCRFCRRIHSCRGSNLLNHEGVINSSLEDGNNAEKEPESEPAIDDFMDENVTIQPTTMLFGARSGSMLQAGMPTSLKEDVAGPEDVGEKTTDLHSICVVKLLDSELQADLEALEQPRHQTVSGDSVFLEEVVQSNTEPCDLTTFQLMLG